MKENKYDDEYFFNKYSLMDRSKKGLAGAGEWAGLQKMLPNFKGSRVLDLGCGFGWHCKYAADNGAVSVIGTDISEKMLDKAQKINSGDSIEYMLKSIEDIDFPPNSFDIVISSLAFHYIKSFHAICQKVNKMLRVGGSFIFSVEHPVFTSAGSQEWVVDNGGNLLHWPVDNYFTEGERRATFLGEQVVKYHRTLSSYINGLLDNGFQLNGVTEPTPSEEMLRETPGMQHELRRPMMIIFSGVKM